MDCKMCPNYLQKHQKQCLCEQAIYRQFESDVKVGVHQGSVLSALLFIIVLVSQEFHTETPGELLYADDLVVSTESEIELRNRLGRWKSELENKGLRVYVGKTKVLISFLLGSECWALVVSDILKLQKNDGAIVRWICRTSLKTCESYLETTLRYNRLRWFS